MIRPLTCVCMLLAGGAGLYLYQTKHQSQMLDREIAHTMKLTDTARARAGVLQAEYALLNDPSRLSELAGEHLASLKTTAPTQFTTWADFEKRLPPVGAPVVAAPPLEPEAPGAKLPEPAAPPVVSATPDTKPEVKPEAKPEATRPLVASVARAVQPAGREPMGTPRSALVQAVQPVSRPGPTPVSLTDQLSPASPQPLPPAHPAAPHPVAASAPPARPAPPRATVPEAPPSGSPAEAVARIARGGPVDPAVPAVASALGMARSMTPPPVTRASAATIWQPSARDQ